MNFSTKIMLIMAMLVFIIRTAFALSSATPTSINESHVNAKKDDKADYEHSSFLKRNGHFLAQQVKAMRSTCNKYPRICRASDSPRPNCCNKNCGKKCNYSEMCCRGKCVNPSRDARNCGRCNNKCGKGNSCLYGLCSYA
ncbi:hypothetical protein I3842_09G093500 [Carya illinoinensis]|uniref:Stigma-specific Stig1 family protein n=1 Tax=Carya illinoinensis TaxID=32201 RepID=A0A922J6M3_CARIL|nr:hypothetical protein I3842_09G093500 [Carya illinoinensis]